MGYWPNSLAQSLVNRKTDDLAFWYSPELNPHLVNIINAIERKVRPYRLTIRNFNSTALSLLRTDELCL